MGCSKKTNAEVHYFVSITDFVYGAHDLADTHTNVSGLNTETAPVCLFGSKREAATFLF